MLDRQALPLKKAAALCAGLPEDCRALRKVGGRRLKTRDALLATIADSLRLLVWAKTKDGQRGRNRPKSILEALERPPEPKDEAVRFDSGEAFERAREKLLK